MTVDLSSLQLVYAEGRNFCFTKKGYIVWVPAAVREGDVIATLYGTRFLFVLRSDLGGYTLKGDCFLRGLMGGEGLKMAGVKDEDKIIV